MLFISDGGGDADDNTSTQMIQSLLGLWKYVKSGCDGIYVIEDIRFNMFEVIMKFIYMYSSDGSDFNQNPLNLTFSKELKEIHKQLLSVRCFAHACVLVKR